MDLHIGRRLTADEVMRLLEEARRRTLDLVSSVSEADLLRQHDPLMSPIAWDLGHIGHFEDVWLRRNLKSGTDGSEGLRGIYDPFEHPRRERGELPLPRLADSLEELTAVRSRVLRDLTTLDLDADDPLLRDGFVFRMVLQHEYQHNETMLQTLQMKKNDPYRPEGLVNQPSSPPPPPRSHSLRDADMVGFPGGWVEIGTDDRSNAYDNERPRHRIELAPFLIDTAPVSEGAYARFIANGGYESPGFWSDNGWAWRVEHNVCHPKYWRRADGGWKVRLMDRVLPLDPRRPVCHVSYHEAVAYAHFVGKRLPTEFEWEAAATWDPSTCTKRRYSWGDEPASEKLANVDVLTFGPAPVGSYVRNVSPIGCYGMIGDVWEWTSSTFNPYPGYESFPYPEYSEAFFGDGYKVLRGGSWATRAGAIRGTFRNWDYPARRQIFSGLRCARGLGSIDDES